MSLDEIRSLVKSELDAVNRFIIENIETQLNIVGEYGSYMTQMQGKQLRPLILILVSKALNDKSKEAIRLAAAIEFFHTATLCHDDIVDHSEFRRGNKTANCLWGNEVSVLLGDFLYAQSMMIILQQDRLDMAKIAAKAIHTISKGEIRQLNNKNITTPNRETYFEIIEAKTAVLFAAAASLGAMVADADPEIIKNIYAYGLHFGNAYQLIDDVLDYASDLETMGKNMGNDLAEGKATLPLIHALENSPESTQQIIRQSLKDGSLVHLEEILAAIKNTHALEVTRQVARDEMKKAIEALAPLPDSPYKQALISFGDFIIERAY